MIGAVETKVVFNPENAKCNGVSKLSVKGCFEEGANTIMKFIAGEMEIIKSRPESHNVKFIAAEVGEASATVTMYGDGADLIYEAQYSLGGVEK